MNLIRLVPAKGVGVEILCVPAHRCWRSASTATACSTVGESSSGDDDDPDTAPTEVVLVTHESFELPKKLQKQFEEESGYELVVRAAGDAGALTNKLVLTKDNPLGDVAFGVDNTFASRALDEDVFAPYDATLPEGAEQLRAARRRRHALTPIDNASVCVNVDDTWFAEHDLAPPATLDDLVDPAYEDLFVTPGATTSSPGMAFLLSTIAAYGDGWPDYWADLMDNGAKLTEGWSDAYQVDFTQGGGKGDRPIVLSYDSSPAFTVSDGVSTTSALLDTCFRQVEYAGVLEGAENPDGAEALVDFLLTPGGAGRAAGQHVRLPGRPGGGAAGGVGGVRRPARRARTTSTRRRSPRTATTWLREWSDVTSR